MDTLMFMVNAFSTLLAVVILLNAPSLQAAYTCEKYGTVIVGDSEYNIQNNVWGAETQQCITTFGESGFRVDSSNHTLGPGRSPAGYPFIWKGCHWEICTENSGLPARVRDITSATFNWSFYTLHTGVWNAVAEAWFKTTYSPGQPDGTELMLWFDSHGVAPAGSIIDVIMIGGTVWEVWFAEVGWNLITYRRRTPTNLAEIDLMPFIEDGVQRKLIKPKWFMMDLEAGFELWNKGAGLQTNMFSFEISTADKTPQQVTDKKSISPKKPFRFLYKIFPIEKK
jgi:hypothetical protein